MAKEYHSVFDFNEKMTEAQLDKQVAKIEKELNRNDIKHIEKSNLDLFSEKVKKIWYEEKEAAKPA